MNRRDFYGSSSLWRNDSEPVSDSSFCISSLKKYGVVIPLFFSTLLTPMPAFSSHARFSKPNYSVSNTKQVLEKKVDRVSDIERYNLDPHVDSKIDKLLARKGSRKSLERTISKLSAYEDYITKASKETGLDPNFIKAYIAQESMGNPYAESSKGAKGLGGLRKLAAKEVKLKVDNHIDERLDPKAIIGSAAYMTKYINRFKDYVLGLISYNAGPTWTCKNRENIIKTKDITKNFSIPSESRDYVVQVMAKTEIFSNPKAYNLKIDKRKLLSRMIRNRFCTKKDTSLDNLSNLYKVKKERLKLVNPSIKNNFIPKGTMVNIPHRK